MLLYEVVDADYSNPTRQVDLLITVDLKNLDTEKKSVGARKIVVASLKELLKLKKAAGRPQDLVDIEHIQEKLNEKK